MMLTVTDASKNYDLTRLATVKAEMGIIDRDHDEKLQTMITQASDIVASFCNRVFALETVVETFRVTSCTQRLILSRYPVTAIVSIVENGTALTADQYEIDLQAGIIERLASNCVTRWGSGKTIVTYSAGFHLPDDAPEGVERATILLVKQYAASGDRDPMIRSESIEGAGSTDYFSGANTGLPPEVEGLLTPHRKPNDG
jgi:hypothetical protein